MNEMDPLARQLPTEPRFALLARDPTAADLIVIWYAIRKRDPHLIDQAVKRLKEEMLRLPYQPHKDSEHIVSAQQVANEFRIWRARPIEALREDLKAETSPAGV